MRSGSHSPERCRRGRVGAHGLRLSGGTAVGVYELLAAVDVKGRAGERRVGHDVYGQSGYVGGSDDTSDGEA